ncbi:hypothetical protein KDX27_22655 [Burkholderia cenocepacia]|uniref:hypothetical protein n=1 Tax=Burkholderia cenocepacia TaxID=95486 RepID=UPI001B9DC49B|nr:hypothetical protein [Burkholderia cenocepacia]MBR8027809.1 hypothetical protein [Burkholderia cenocepacia]MBR8170539.1 hypothetical protein [Burkholderia cenocepacia]
MSEKGRSLYFLWKKSLPKSVLFLASASFVGVAPNAVAECHVAIPTVIMCQGANNAALAYKAYGMNVKKIDTSYTREILHQSYCATITDPKRTLTFGRLQTGRVATPDGWVDVTFVGWLRDGVADTRYVAAPYLRGICPKISMDDLRSDPNAMKNDPRMPTIIQYNTDGI